jgi:hypothetical protein
VPSFNNQGSEILMFHILEGINEEKNRNGTNKTFIERVCNVVIPCHKCNLEPILVDYIYLNFGEKAKRANPVKWICPIGKTISQIFSRL